jgi:hypothetical protein
MKTEELHRCIKAEPGIGYIVDCTVCTTAPYGECWRTVCRYSISTAADTSVSQLRIDYCMVYAKPVSSWMRRIIEPAAESGLAKNFAQFIAVLSRFVTLSDAAEPVATVSEAGAAQALEEAPKAASKRQKVVALLTAFGARRRIASVATVLVDDHLLDLFLPLAEIILAGLTGRSPMSGGMGVRSVASGLSTLLVGYLLQLVLRVWHWLGAKCADHTNVASRMCLRLYSSLDLPHSVAGLFMTIGVLFMVRNSLGGFAKVRFCCHFMRHPLCYVRAAGVVLLP